MRTLAERLDSFPEPWKPKPGDKLIGEVIDLDERESEYGTYPIVIVASDEGEELAFHAFRTVARNELAKQRPQVGDRIGIAYHGKPEGRDYELYRIVVERDERPAVDWDKHVGEEPDTEPEPELEPSGKDDDDIPF
jgi:hypothetical protein